MRTVIETKAIMVNLMMMDNKDYLIVDKFLELIDFIGAELNKKNVLSNYHIALDLNVYSLERCVNFNIDLFCMDLDMKVIRLRKNNAQKKLAEKYPVDETINKIIKEFVDTQS